MRYGHLCGFLEAKLVILGPIDFLFGFCMQDTFARATHSAKRARDDRVSCIQIWFAYQSYSVNAGQNKFEVDILKNVAKIANLRPNRPDTTFEPGY